MDSTQQDLDETQLAELREDLGDAFKDFVDRFLEGAGNLPSTLESELAAGELTDAAVRAHQLKGIAGYLGAVKLVDTLGQVQCAAQAGNRDEVRTLLQVLQSDLATVTPLLAACLAAD